jgi:hypothetical protein
MISAHFCDRTGPDFMQPTYTLGRVLCFASLLASIPVRLETRFLRPATATSSYAHPVTPHARTHVPRLRWMSSSTLT